jgi:N-acyl-D-amino-acid deacylase
VYRTLIKNGLVFDGEGGAPIKTDVLLTNGRIARLGNFSKTHVGVVVDATGSLVMPGFIDISNDSDHYLSVFHTPHLEELVRQGVTTIMCGNCGSSLAPLLDGSLESMRKWSEPSGVNVNWHSVGEFLSVLEKRGIGVNFGTLVGHSTIRRAITKERFRDLTDREMDALFEIVKASIDDGAFGFSTGLSYVHASRVPYYEIERLVRATAAKNGIYATHVRNAEEGIVESIEETLEIAKRTGVNVEISHLEPLKDFGEQYERALSAIEDESAKSHVHFDVYPFDATALALYEFLPGWMQEGGLELMLSKINEKKTDSRLLEYFLRFTSRDIVIGHVANRTLKFLEGKTLKSFAESHDMPLNVALLHLMKVTALRAVLFYRNVDTKALGAFLTHPNAIISSDGVNFRDQATFPAYIKYVTEKKVAPLEQAIKKITSLPAKKFGIARRGIIKEGCFADIVVLKDGIPQHVFVNGIHALKDGTAMKTLSGNALRSTDS